jgi:outer membrane protein TolC
MKSTSLINDLKVLERRRSEISEDVENANRSYSTAQENLVKGTATASDVTTAHSTALALQAGLSSLDNKIEEKRARFAKPKPMSRGSAIRNALLSCVTKQPKRKAPLKMIVRSYTHPSRHT